MFNHLPFLDYRFLSFLLQGRRGKRGKRGVKGGKGEQVIIGHSSIPVVTITLQNLI